MTPLDAGIAVAIAASVGGLAAHHRFRRAREARIHAEADAFGGRLHDDSE